MLRSVLKQRPTPSMAVAIAAAVMSLAGSATAASLITSKQIKDNTIVSADVKNRSLNLADFNPSVQKALAAEAGPAPAGPAGPEGPTGPAGPAGEQGAPGLSEVEIVTANTEADNEDKFKQVDCPAGKIAISTGASATVKAGHLTQVRPLAGGTGAIATAVDDPDKVSSWQLIVTATCAKVG